MYSNCGKKLMGIIRVITLIGIVASFLMGFLIGGYVIGGGLLWILLIAGAGCVLVWLSNLVLATFAEMAMDVHEIAECSLEALEREVPIAEVPAWRCTSCGQSNSERAAYCRVCGKAKNWTETVPNKNTAAQDSVACPQCGSLLKSGDAFCVRCGAKTGR